MVVSTVRPGGQCGIVAVVFISQELFALLEIGDGVVVQAQMDGVGPRVGQHGSQGYRVYADFLLECDCLPKSIRGFLKAAGFVKNLAVIIQSGGQRGKVAAFFAESSVDINRLLLIAGSFRIASQNAHGGGQLFIVGSNLILGTGLVRGQKQNIVDLPGVFLQNSGNFGIGPGDTGEPVRQAVGQLLQYLHGASFRSLGTVPVISCLVHQPKGHGAGQEKHRCGNGCF